MLSDGGKQTIQGKQCCSRDEKKERSDSHGQKGFITSCYSVGKENKI